jgi:hypothetical protein
MIASSPATDASVPGDDRGEEARGQGLVAVPAAACRLGSTAWR